MKRLFIIAAALLSWTAAIADEPAIRNIKIGCVLDKEGAANITEWWDVTAVKGTEWYLVRENLRDIEIQNLSVTDESGLEYKFEGEWDVDRGLSEKAGKCGIHTTSSGCEICWGLGSYGDHIYKVKYKMTNAAKSLNDYDMLHLQFISDQLSSNPDHFKLVLEIPDVQLDTTNARIWGFGYYGEVWFEKGRVVMESSQALNYHSSVILLLRLDKGLIYPTSTLDIDFQDQLDMAMKGSDWEDMQKTPAEKRAEKIQDILSDIVAGLICGGWIPLALIFGWFADKAKKKKWFGTTKFKEIPWNRDIPFDGDLLASNYVLKQAGEAKDNARIAAAMILRMIQDGALGVRKVSEKKVDIYFKDPTKAVDYPKEMAELWNFMEEASGEDLVLQDKEFSTWSNAHQKKVSDWLEKVEKGGRDALVRKGLLLGTTPTRNGVEENRKMIGLKTFLSEFTLIKERLSGEVILWQDYLTYGALLGIADKVAEELKDIDPKYFKETQLDTRSLDSTIYTTSHLARCITAAKSAYDKSQSASSGGSGYSGGGGHSSYGGGGGFSGGGHGGGCR